MATRKQTKAANIMVGNGGNVSQAMREAGYSENTVNTPQKLTESKGFQEVAKELGLTDELIAAALVQDIQSNVGNRSKELALAIKVRGLEKTIIDVTTKGEAINRDPQIAADFADYLKNKD